MAIAPPRKAVILLSHIVSDMVRARYLTLRATLHPEFDVVLVLTAPVPDTSGIADLVLLSEDEIFLPAYGRKSANRSILPGNCELPVLAFFRRRPWYQSVWQLEYDVWLPCGGETLREIDQASDADLIVTQGIARPEATPDWHWWTTFAPPDWARERLAAGRTGYSLFMISRFGPRLFAALERGYRNGWSGHHEATVTSIALEQDLKVENLNAIGLRACGRRLVRIETFHVHRCQPIDASTFYHPVKNQDTEDALRAAIFPAAPSVLPSKDQGNPPPDPFPIEPALKGTELEFFRAKLLKHARFYGEFGVGGSTVLAALAPVQRVVAVESDPRWLCRLGGHSTMRPLIEAGTVTLLHGDVGEVGDWGYPITRPASGAAYFEAPWARWSELGETPDHVFIDGRYRVACALAALRFARLTGAACSLRILLNDYTPQRRYYQVLAKLMNLSESCGALSLFTDTGIASDEELLAALVASAADAR